jgi:hypothetical protein
MRKKGDKYLISTLPREATHNVYKKPNAEEHQAIPMTITTELWHEKLFSTISFLNPWSKARRDSRKVIREVKALLLKLEPELQKAEATGDVTKVEKVSMHMVKLHQQIALQLLDELVQVRLALAKQLKLLSAAKRDLHSNKHIQPADREKYSREIETGIASILDIINKLFQNLTSLESINTSLKQNLHEDTLAQIVKSEMIQATQEVKVTVKEEERVEREAASSDSAELSKDLDRLLKDMKEQNEELKKALGDALQLFQKNIASLRTQESHVRDLIEQQGFPKGIGEALITADERALKDIHQKLLVEIEKKRREMSAAEHA